jgi:hypothetical protein
VSRSKSTTTWCCDGRRKKSRSLGGKQKFSIKYVWAGCSQNLSPRDREHPESNLGAIEQQAVVLPPENLGIKPGLTEPGAISRTRVRVVLRVNPTRDGARLQPRG